MNIKGNYRPAVLPTAWQRIIGFLILFVGISGNLIWNNGKQFTYTRSQQFLFLFVVLQTVAVYAWWIWYRNSRKKKQKQTNSVTDLSEVKTLPAESILYLRPFKFSGKLAVRNTLRNPVDRFLLGKWWDLELAISAFAKHRLAAIGHVDGSYGAEKLITSDADWFGVFKAVAEEAKAIFVVMLHRPSTIEEISHILNSQDLLSKTIFIMPPSKWIGFPFYRTLRGLSVKRSWKRMQTSLEDRIYVPEYSRRGAFLFYFDVAAPPMVAPFFDINEEVISRLFSVVAGRVNRQGKPEIIKAAFRRPSFLIFWRFINFANPFNWIGAIYRINLLLIILMCIRFIFYIPMNIPSGSMIPTLNPGDYVLINKFIYGYSSLSNPILPFRFSGRIFGTRPSRGDVVALKLPRDNKTDYLKRIIGLPGEKIQMVKGRLYINGNIVPRQVVESVQTEDYYGRDRPVVTYEETLPGGLKHRIVEIQGDDGFNDNTEVFEVPPDAYFVMGDNRDNSTDSRVPPDQGGVGFVPYENLVGKVEAIYWSDADDRILTSVR